MTKQLHELDHTKLPEIERYLQMLCITVWLKGLTGIFEILHRHFKQ